MAQSRTKSKTQTFWEGQIAGQLKRETKWRDCAKNIVKRYRSGKRNVAQLNILWSNTEILKAATFSRLPEANFQRRFKNSVLQDPAVKIQDAISRDGAMVLEDAVKFYADDPCFVPSIRKARDDMLLPGRGVPWIEYEVEIERLGMEVAEYEDQGTVIKIITLDGVERDPDGYDGENPYIEQVKSECVELKYVFWEDFLHSNSRDWESVWWVARRHGMQKSEMIDMFGEEKVNSIDRPTEEQDDSENHGREVFAVWEIWDKARKERVWMTQGAPDALLVEEPPIDLEGFFPCPKPLYPFETNDTLEPVPEFTIYESQANQIDIIEQRLKALTQSLKAAGFYNSHTSEIVNLEIATDGQLIPVNFSKMGGEGTLQQQIMYLPLGEIVTTIDKLTQRKAELKNEIYEITGISDIVRGANDPSETATSSRLKGSYGNIRLRPRREPIEEMIRDIYRIMAEIIADKFDKSTIEQIVGRPVNNLVMQMLRDQKLRQFRIDVETDTTVQPNQEIDKQAAMQFLGAMGGFMQQAVVAVQSAPQIAPVAGAMVKFAASQFKAGRELEGLIDETVDQLQAAPQAQEQDPAAEAEMMKAQIEQQKLQVEMFKAQNERAEIELRAREMGYDLAIAQIDATIQRETNQKDLMEENIRAGTSITTAEINSAMQERENITQITTEALKTRTAGV